MGCGAGRRRGLSRLPRTGSRAVVRRGHVRLGAALPAQLAAVLRHVIFPFHCCRRAVYIELHTSSAFSFLRAATLPEPLIERAALLGYPAVALLDRDGVYGAPRFHKAATAAGLRPI